MIFGAALHDGFLVKVKKRELALVETLSEAMKEAKRYSLKYPKQKICIYRPFNATIYTRFIDGREV